MQFCLNLVIIVVIVIIQRKINVIISGRDHNDVLVAICGRNGDLEQPEGQQLLVLVLLALTSDLHVGSGEDS